MSEATFIPGPYGVVEVTFAVESLTDCTDAGSSRQEALRRSICTSAAAM